MSVVALGLWLAWIMWYTVRADWWDTPYGRNNVYVSLVVAGLLAADTYKMHPMTQSAIYACAMVAGVHRIVLLERARRENNNGN